LFSFRIACQQQRRENPKMRIILRLHLLLPLSLTQEFGLVYSRCCCCCCFLFFLSVLPATQDGLQVHETETSPAGYLDGPTSSQL
jgi:hypothetical protein